MNTGSRKITGPSKREAHVMEVRERAENSATRWARRVAKLREELVESKECSHFFSSAVKWLNSGARRYRCDACMHVFDKT